MFVSFFFRLQFKDLEAVQPRGAPPCHPSLFVGSGARGEAGLIAGDKVLGFRELNRATMCISAVPCWFQLEV